MNGYIMPKQSFRFLATSPLYQYGLETVNTNSFENWKLDTNPLNSWIVQIFLRKLD